MNFDQYREQTDKYSSSIVTAVPNALNSLDKLRDRLSDSVQSLIISNINKHKKNNAYYIVKVNSDQIEILEVDNDQKNHYLYQFSDESLFLNNESVASEESNLSERFASIIEDLKLNKSKIYEESA